MPEARFVASRNRRFSSGSSCSKRSSGAPIDRFEQELPELKRLLREATMRAAGIAQALVEDAGRA